MSEVADTTLTRRVFELAARDVGRGLIRIDPDDLTALGARPGDIVAVAAAEDAPPAAVLRALPTPAEQRGRGVGIDGIERRNADLAVGERAFLTRIDPPRAVQVQFEAIGEAPALRPRDIVHLLQDRALLPGTRVRLEFYGRRAFELKVRATTPAGPVLVAEGTRVAVSASSGEGGSGSVSYEDIGGLGREVARVRELVEVPLRYPEVFRRLGVEPPRGVLLYGPPGTGKTLIARAVARESGAHFISVAGPEIVGKYYGESEKRLREIFAEARAKAPSVVFLDEIDAIGAKREDAQGDVERRVVAQLLTLMDGLDGRGQVLVIGATNRPDDLDEALRRPGRFDREVMVGVPDREARAEILAVHTRSMPLAEDVDLARLAQRTHGYVGADLAALCREAALERVRELVPAWTAGESMPGVEDLERLEVRAEDFETALRRVVPSAMREVFSEVAPASWQDVGGLGRIKERLRDLIELPLSHGELFDAMRLEPPRGILLAGPPGTGKTLVARAVAHEIEANFILMRGAQLLSKYVGESEQAVRELFRRARATAPCIVFFDEIDGFMARRAGDDAVNERVVGQFLTEMDGALSIPGVVLLASTNRPEALDPALLRSGRFETVLTFPLPDAAARREILSVHLRGRPLADDVDEAALAALADRLERRSGADLERLCRRAAGIALRRAVNETTPSAPRIRLEDLTEALRDIEAG